MVAVTITGVLSSTGMSPIVERRPLAGHLSISKTVSIDSMNPVSYKTHPNLVASLCYCFGCHQGGKATHHNNKEGDES